MAVTVLYFAWVRERIGRPKETIEFAGSTVTDLVELLCAKEERYAAAFSDISSLRVAVNQDLVDFGALLKDGSEIAFFPPMTGG